MISNQLLGMTEDPKGTAPPCTDQKQFLLTFFTTLLIAEWSKEAERSKKFKKNCIRSVIGKTIPLRCSIVFNQIRGRQICDFY